MIIKQKTKKQTNNVKCTYGIIANLERVRLFVRLRRCCWLPAFWRCASRTRFFTIYIHTHTTTITRVIISYSCCGCCCGTCSGIILSEQRRLSESNLHNASFEFSQKYHMIARFHHGGYLCMRNSRDVRIIMEKKKNRRHMCKILPPPPSLSKCVVILV